MPNSTSSVDTSEQTSQKTMAATLEQKYIELLEQKIAVLQESLADQKKDSTKPGLANAKRSVTEKLDNITSSKDSAKEPQSNQVNPDEKTISDKASRVRLLDYRYNAESGGWDEAPAKSLPTKLPEPEVPYAITWRRRYDEENKYGYTELFINQRELQSLLKETCKSSPAARWDRLMSPFRGIIYDWEALNNAANDFDDEGTSDRNIARQDLKELLTLVKGCPDLETYFQQVDKWKAASEITFEFLWTLFPPGSMVFSNPIQKMPQAFISKDHITKDNPERPGGSSKKEFVLTAWSYDWDGEQFNRVATRMKIAYFEGAKAINSLLFYPIEYHVDPNTNTCDPENIKAILKKRGEKFRKICISEKGSQLFDYDGHVIPVGLGIMPFGGWNDTLSDDGLSYNSNKDVQAGLGITTVKGQAIVDHKSFLQYCQTDYSAICPMGDLQVISDAAECSCSECMQNVLLKRRMRVDYDHINKSQKFEDDQYIICPPRFLGYVMHEKLWAQLMVDYTNIIKEKVKEDAFEKLIMDPNIKNLIKGLVGNHEKKKKKDEFGNDSVLEDIVEGKGKGLVILLHGPPGVGKTSTAESVAKATGKPLFMVSVSDIGLEPENVEPKLGRIFNLAALWEAVLLFDEADVFLESRGREHADLRRNSLVTVLLRVLEYFDGILILTTNRIKTFDIAVQSRVHLAVRYEQMPVDIRKRLFMNFLKQCKDSNTEDKAAIEKWVDEEFEDEIDGRQIRNVLSSAMGLSRSPDNPSGKLRLIDIKRVLKMTNQFQLHLRDQRVQASRTDQV